MNNYNLGCKILLITGISLIIIGLYAVLFNNTPLFVLINQIMDPKFWENEKLSIGTLNFKIFSWSLLGMFHIIWGLFILYSVRYGLIKEKKAWAWQGILSSVITWLFVVVYFSLTTKLFMIFFNPFTIFFVITFIIPLIMTKGVLKASNEKK